MNKYCMAFTTVNNIDEAQKIINTILELKLAACIQTINIGSHYTWKAEVCHDEEVLILFKTSWDLYDMLETKIKEIHPYDTPEIIAIELAKGYKGYLEWIDEVTKK